MSNTPLDVNDVSGAITPDIIKALNQNDPSLQLDVAKRLRELLEDETNSPIAEIIKTGVVDRFVQFLADDAQPLLQIEAARILAMLASGNSTHTQAVIEAGAVPALIQQLTSQKESLIECCMWALRNIAGDSPDCRDYVLNQNILPPLLGLFNQQMSLSMTYNASTILLNLCRGDQPRPDFSQLSQCLPVLARLIHHENAAIVENVCWSLVYIEQADQIQAIIDMGICDRLVELLSHESSQVVSAVIRVVGNIVTGNDLQTQTMMDSNLLPALLALLSHPTDLIVKEACWTLSNIIVGTREQLQAVIDFGIMSPLIRMLSHRDSQVRREAVWAIKNATGPEWFLDEQSIVYLVEKEGVIAPLCSLLSDDDSVVIEVTLDALVNILRAGDKIVQSQTNATQNPYAFLMEQCGGLNKMVSLQTHGHPEIRNKVSDIVEQHLAETFGKMMSLN